MSRAEPSRAERSAAVRRAAPSRVHSSRAESSPDETTCDTRRGRRSAQGNRAGAVCAVAALARWRGAGGTGRFGPMPSIAHGCGVALTVVVSLMVGGGRLGSARGARWRHMRVREAVERLGGRHARAAAPRSTAHGCRRREHGCGTVYGCWWEARRTGRHSGWWKGGEIPLCGFPRGAAKYNTVVI